MRGFLTLILIQCLHRSINKNIVAQENRKVNEIVILSPLSAYTLLSDDIILSCSNSNFTLTEVHVRDVKRYFYNSILLSLSSILMRSVAVAFNVYVTGKVGAEGMGVLSLISSAYGFAVTFATSGISIAVTRLCAETVMADGIRDAEKKLRRVMMSSIFYSLILGGIAGAVLFFGAEPIGKYLLGDERAVSSIKILAVTLSPTAVVSALSGYFNASRRVYKNAVTQVLGQGIRIFVTVTAFTLILPPGVEYALIAVTLGNAAAEIGSFLVTFFIYIFDRNRYFKRNSAPVSQSAEKSSSSVSLHDVTASSSASESSSMSKPTRTELSADSTAKTAGSLFSAAAPVMLSACFRSGLVTLEHILIPKGLEKSGNSYGSALSSYGTLTGMVLPVIMFPYAILGSFTSLLVPEMSLCRANGQHERIRHIGRLVFRATLIFAAGISGILILFSREIGLALYKSEEAGEYIRFLAPIIPVMYLDTASDSMLKGLGQQLFCMRVNIADAALSLVLVTLLVPTFGIKGYAAVIIIAEIVNASLSIRKLLSIAEFDLEVFRWIFRPLFSSLLSCAGIRVLINSVRRIYSAADSGYGLILFIIAAVSLYFAILTATNTVTPSDIKYFTGIFKKEDPRKVRKTG